MCTCDVALKTPLFPESSAGVPLIEHIFRT